MNEVLLTDKERKKYEAIQSLVDNQGSVQVTAARLGLSTRQVYRLMSVYRTQGAKGFSHGNKGKKPSSAKPDALREQILDLYRTRYSDTNMAQFSRIVEKELGVQVNSHTILNWLDSIDMVSPRAHKKTRLKMQEKHKEADCQ